MQAAGIAPMRCRPLATTAFIFFYHQYQWGRFLRELPGTECVMSEEWVVEAIEDDASGLMELIRNAEQGDAFAQNILAAKLASGDCFQKDSIGAFYWYCRAIKSGYTHAKWNAGSLMIDGSDGVPHDRDIAWRLIEEAAEANQTSACLFIAQCFRDGSYGKPVDADEEQFWQKKAWNQTFREFSAPMDVFAEAGLDIPAPAMAIKRQNFFA